MNARFRRAKAFTLVELMIVVAIIGVLATTLLPVLNGAQERARDGGRVASLNQVATALATFNSDAGQFPLATATAGADSTGFLNCLSNGSGATASDLALLLKGGMAPLDPQRQSLAGNCAQRGAYGYFPLQKEAIDRTSFVLVVDVETAKKGNYNYCTATALKTASTGLGDSAARNRYDDWFVGAGNGLAVLSSEPLATNKKCSTYVVTN